MAEQNNQAGFKSVQSVLSSKINIVTESVIQNISDSSCPYCGQPIPPLLFTEIGEEVQDPAQASYTIPRQFCTCPDGQQAKERQEAAKNRQDWLDRARLLIQDLDTGKYGDYRFSNWDRERYPGAGEVIDQIRAYIDHVIHDRTKRWLFMSGLYGLGKTHLAIASLRQIAAEKLWNPLAVVWPEHCSQVQQSWRQDRSESGLTEGRLWGRMRSARILLIDDIDKMESSKWAIQKLYEVIDHRVNRRRLTIITANHSIKQLRDLWLESNSEHIRDIGSAILSRIAGELYGAVEFPEDVEDQRWT